MASTAAGVAVGSTIGHTLGAGISSMVSLYLPPCQLEPNGCGQMGATGDGLSGKL